MKRLITAVCIISAIVFVFINIYNSNDFSLTDTGFNAERETYILLYYGDKTKNYLIPEARLVHIKGEKIEEIILKELVKDPVSQNHYSLIPNNKDYKIIKLKDGIIYIEIGKNFVEVYDKTINKDLMIAAIVNSFTELSDVKGVQFFVGGSEWGTVYKRIRNAFFRENLNPSEVVKKQMSFEKEGDWLSAYALMSDNEDNEDRKYYDSYIKELQEARDEGFMNADFEVGEYKIDSKDPNKAFVKINFIVKGSNGTYEKGNDIYFTTVKIDGFWRVDWLTAKQQ